MRVWVVRSCGWYIVWPIGNDGLVYVCDRQSDRIQVFDKMGNFKRNISIKRESRLPDNWGTTWWIRFSADHEQKNMYVNDGGNERIKFLDHASGRVVASSDVRPPGRCITHAHTLAVDSKGNVYVARPTGVEESRIKARKMTSTALAGRATPLISIVFSIRGTQLTER